MAVADPIFCPPIRLSARPSVGSQLGRLAQIHMFQLALPLRGIEVEQHADATRQAVRYGDLGGAQQGYVQPAESSRGPRGILGGEVRGRGEDRALDVLGGEAV